MLLFRVSLWCQVCLEILYIASNTLIYHLFMCLKAPIVLPFTHSDLHSHIYFLQASIHVQNHCNLSTSQDICTSCMYHALSVLYSTFCLNVHEQVKPTVLYNYMPCIYFYTITALFILHILYFVSV